MRSLVGTAATDLHWRVTGASASLERLRPRDVDRGRKARRALDGVLVAAVEALFDDEGWKLEVEDRGPEGFVAWFWLDSNGTRIHEAHGRTRVEAAESAWTKYLARSGSLASHHAL